MAAASCAATSVVVALLLSAVKQPDFRPPSVIHEEVDFLVVGGGSAGCVVAAKLAQVGHWKVTLLEAGPEQPPITRVPALYSALLSRDDIHWRLPTQPSNGLDKDQIISRGKMLGGCSSHNGLTYLHGNKDDFNRWEEAGARGWGYDDVLPIYRQLEDVLDADLRKNPEYHGTHGPQPVERPRAVDVNMKALVDALKEGGLPENKDPNGASQFGVFYAPQSSGRGRRFSSNNAFLEPERWRKNLQVITGALATKVHINEFTTRAEAVEYKDQEGRRRVIRARKEIILTAGTYGSPQLLLLSGVGPEEDLKAAGVKPVVNLPTVGKNLQDHYSSDFTFEVDLTTSAIIPTDDQVVKDAKAFNKGEGPFTTTGTEKVTVLVKSPLQPSNDPRPYIQSIVDVSWKNGSGLENYCEPIKGTFCYYDHLRAAVVVLHPTSKGYLTLNTTSPESFPLIYQNVFSEPIDVKIQAEATWSLYNMYASSEALKNIGATVIIPDVAACDGIKKESLEFFECAVNSSAAISWGHGVGTCRMGDNKDGVVDSQLRVKGVLGLRVMDAATIPETTSGNTNAPTMMVAFKGAEMIIKDWTERGDLFPFRDEEKRQI